MSRCMQKNLMLIHGLSEELPESGSLLTALKRYHSRITKTSESETNGTKPRLSLRQKVEKLGGPYI